MLVFLKKLQSWTKILVFYVSGYPYQTVHPVRNFLAVLPPPPPSPPPTLQCNIETLKEILDTGVQLCLWGWGMCELKKILTN